MKLLITGAWKCTQEQLNTIQQIGHSIVFMQNEQDPIPCAYEDVEGVICNGLFLSNSEYGLLYMYDFKKLTVDINSLFSSYTFIM